MSGPNVKLQGENHRRARFTAADIAKMRERAASGERQVDIAKDYEAAPEVIGNIIRRVTWKHLP